MKIKIQDKGRTYRIFIPGWLIWGWLTLRLVCYGLLHIVFDIVTVITVNAQDVVSPLVNRMLHICFYLSGIWFIIGFYQYVIHLCGLYRRMRLLKSAAYVPLLLFAVLLLFLPVFGNGTDSPASVSLYAITGISTWIKMVFAALIGVTVLNGICGVIISHFEKPIWNRHRLVTGIVLSVACTAVFILTRQPYAGIICLAILVVKGLLIGKGKSFL